MNHLATATLLAAFAAFWVGAPAHAATRTVPGTHATVQAAVTASAYGDVVSIGAGTFMENVNLKNGVTLQGSGKGVTVIDGKAVSSAIYVVGGASALTRIQDLTVTNGKAANGGGIKADNGNQCEIRRVEVVDNVATSKGGGIYVGQNSATKIIECVITGNSAPNGGGIYLQTSQSQVEYNLIYDNVATAMGGGLFAAQDRSGIIWNTIDGNSSNGYGAGAVFSQSSVKVHTTIFSNNSGGYGVWTNRAIDERCNDFWANGLGAMYGQTPHASDLLSDPMFCNRPGHDFHLNFASPCIVGSCEKQVGALGPQCGQQPTTATDATTWGGLKGLFSK